MVVRAARCVVAAVAISVLVIVPAGRAAACSCVPDQRSFFESARGAKIVVVGRIQALGRAKGLSVTGEPAVAYLDIEVLGFVRGSDPRGIVRIWDGGFGTNCSLNLARYKVDSHAAFVVEQAGASRREQWAPAPHDYVLAVCGQRELAIESRAKAAEFLKDARW
jgi:hypothetical protein